VRASFNGDYETRSVLLRASSRGKQGQAGTGSDFDRQDGEADVSTGHALVPKRRAGTPYVLLDFKLFFPMFFWIPSAC
jgi:hypothetical protein